VIPYKANEKNKPAYFAEILYKARARIEQGFGRLKRIQTCRAPMRKNGTQLPLRRKLRRRTTLDQTRLLGLATCQIYEWFDGCRHLQNMVVVAVASDQGEADWMLARRVTRY